MPGKSLTWCGRALTWWIQRNPSYLVSAAFMAVGARMLLVSPSGRAGAIGLILLTLGVLQLYEAAVGAIVVALHRSRRSPEDEPSLLLVGALFWTGPLAATAEMTARGGRLGLVFAVGACAIALWEFRFVRRQLRLGLSVWSRLIACVCVLLLGAAPPLLRVPEPVNGTNEIFLYFCWWLLGGVGLLSLGSLRFHTKLPEWPLAAPSNRFHLQREMCFIGLVIGATAIQLYAMNYAFFGHARAFYAVPLILSIAVLAFDALARVGGARAAQVTLSVCLPAGAILLSIERFDPEVPVQVLPRPLQDPLLIGLFASGLVWWFGRLRLGSVLMFHAGSLSLAGAAWRGLRLLGLISVPGPMTNTVPRDLRDTLVLLLYVLIIYLLLVALLRRSSLEVLAAIIVHQVAVTALVWGRTDADDMIVLLSVGWHLFIWVHVLNWWPRTTVVLWPVGMLAAVTWAYDLSPTLLWAARGHAVVLLGVLVLVGSLRPWTRYRLIAAGLACLDVVFYAGRWIGTGDHPREAIVVFAGFAMLAGGAAISWHKRALLELSRDAGDSDAESTAESCAVQPSTGD